MSQVRSLDKTLHTLWVVYQLYRLISKIQKITFLSVSIAIFVQNGVHFRQNPKPGFKNKMWSQIITKTTSFHMHGYELKQSWNCVTTTVYVHKNANSQEISDMTSHVSTGGAGTVSDQRCELPNRMWEEAGKRGQDIKIPSPSPLLGVHSRHSTTKVLGLQDIHGMYSIALT